MIARQKEPVYYHGNFQHRCAIGILRAYYSMQEDVCIEPFDHYGVLGILPDLLLSRKCVERSSHGKLISRGRRYYAIEIETNTQAAKKLKKIEAYRKLTNIELWIISTANVLKLPFHKEIREMLP